MREMLERGFTSVRDAGGADHGLALAQQRGLFIGPRIVHGGLALSQTGGHADFRDSGDGSEPICRHGVGRVVDGVDEIRHAARDEIRKNAHHIKVMASGGVASPTDRRDAFLVPNIAVYRVLEREGREHELGEIPVGAQADLILLRANPLDDVQVLTDPDKHLDMVVQGGPVAVRHRTKSASLG
jgi:imidazolonepropionase-like amidohydrolase